MAFIIVLFFNVGWFRAARLIRALGNTNIDYMKRLLISIAIAVLIVLFLLFLGLIILWVGRSIGSPMVEEGSRLFNTFFLRWSLLLVGFVLNIHPADGRVPWGAILVSWIINIAVYAAAVYFILEVRERRRASLIP